MDINTTNAFNELEIRILRLHVKALERENEQLKERLNLHERLVRLQRKVMALHQ